MSVDGLERLEVWRRAKDLCIRVYREVLPILPVEEKWGLAAQLRRSAQSIPSNIAEGYGRFYFQENVRFCYIARGSLEETLSHLSLAHDLEMIPGAIYASMRNDGDTLVRLINGYIGYLKRTRSGSDEGMQKHTIRETGCDYEPVQSDNFDSSLVQPDIRCNHFDSDQSMLDDSPYTILHSPFSTLESRTDLDSPLSALDDPSTEEY